jgi:2-iminobutanoate/2-iminopropanoate deaminase
MSKEIIYTANAPEPLGPYSQAILVGNTLYCSGQIAIDPSNNQVITGTVEEEVHQIMRNHQAVLSKAGFEFKDVVKASIFVKDLTNFVKINEVYGQYLGEAKPARETVEVSRLPKDVQVEISLIAVK